MLDEFFISHYCTSPLERHSSRGIALTSPAQLQLLRHKKSKSYRWVKISESKKGKDERRPSYRCSNARIIIEAKTEHKNVEARLAINMPRSCTDEPVIHLDHLVRLPFGFRMVQGVVERGDGRVTTQGERKTLKIDKVLVQERLGEGDTVGFLGV